MNIAPVRRKRGGFVAAGVGVLAIAGVTAGVIVFTGGTSAGSTPSRESDLAHQVEANVAHLREVLPKLMPDAKDIKVDYDQPYGADVALFTASVTFTDGDGPGTFNLTVSADPGSMTPLAENCVPGSGLSRTDPDGKPLRCDKIKQPNGDTVVLSEDGTSPELDGVVTQVDRLDAIDYRGGDLTVSTWNDRDLPQDLVPEGGSARRPSYPLDERQLIALVTDPAFTLH